MSRQIPLLRRQNTRCLPSSPSNVTRFCEFPFSADSSCCRNDALRFLTQTSRVVVQVPTMVLSETFRLSLFLVIRGGIGFLERLGARSTRSLTALWILTLEPERLENQPVIIRDESGMDSRQTLKLLVVLGIRRRNGLLSSTRSKRWPRSCAPG